MLELKGEMMDTYTFIDNLIKTLAWPLVTFVTILLFKQPIGVSLAAISKKIEGLKKAKHKDSEILFDTNKAISLIQNAELPIIKKQDGNPEKDIRQLIRNNEKEIRNNQIEMGVNGCVLAVVLFHKATFTRIPRDLLHKSIGMSLKEMINLLKECRPDSPNFEYYEKVLNSHLSSTVEK